MFPSHDPKIGDGIKYFDLNITNKSPFDRKVTEDVVESVNIIKGDGKGGQILQSQKGQTLMSKTNDFRMLGARNASLEDMLDASLDIAEEGENFLNGAKYSFSELNDINFSLNLSWQ